MKKKTISLILALILLLSCSATAQATSVQAATPSASITINGTTATCRVSIAKPGKTIHATLQLWQGRTMIDSWSGNGTSYLLITGSHEVTKGKTYTVKVVWNGLEQSSIWLQVTNYPTRKIIQVNIGEE